MPELPNFDTTLVVGKEDAGIKAHILKSTGEDCVETELEDRVDFAVATHSFSASEISIEM